MEELYVRQAKPDDVSEIRQILDHAVHAKMHHGDLAWGDVAYSEEWLHTALTDGTLFVAKLGSETVGTFRLDLQDDAMWGVQPPVAGYVQRFAVASGHRGERLGSRIFDIIAQLVLHNGRQFVRLTCPLGNKKLCAYHESNGFYRADAKAKPAVAQQSVAYYERLADPSYTEVATPQKKGVLHRLKSIHIGPKYT